MTVVETVSAVGLIADPRSTLREQGIGRHMPQAWAPSDGYVRKTVATVAALLVILATLVAIPIAAPGVTARASAADAPGNACGIDAVFVLDRSGSMSQSDINKTVAAVNGVLTDLAGTGSRIGIAWFRDTATKSAETPSLTPVGEIAGTWNDGYDDEGRTNWDAGLKLGNSFAPADALVFITDGDPNVDSNTAEHGGVPPFYHNPVGSDTEMDLARDHTVAISGNFDNVFGIGAGTFGPKSKARLESVVGTGNVITTGFDGLDAELEKIFRGLCTAKLTILKTTSANGDTKSTGLMVDAGDEVTWNYTVTNSGLVPITGIHVTDNMIADDAADISCAPLDNDAGFTLDPGAVAECSASGIAAGDFGDKYENNGKAAGTYDPPGDNNTEYPEATDDSDYTIKTPPAPELTIEKTSDKGTYTEGEDITYKVTFTNSSDVFDIVVTDLTDDIGGSTLNLLEFGVAEPNTCNEGAIDGGDDATINVPPEGTSCTFTIEASLSMDSYDDDDRCDKEQGEFKDLATAVGTYGDDGETTADDCASVDVDPEPVHPSIEVTKSVTSGNPVPPTGGNVTYQVKIQNDGDVAVKIDVLTDEVGGKTYDLLADAEDADLLANTCNDAKPIIVGIDGDFACSFTLFVDDETSDAAEPLDCDVDNYVVDVVEAKGFADAKDKPTTSDADCAEVTIGDNPPPTDRPSIDIEKATNGVDADAAPGPSIAVGSAVAWTYTVRNTGDVSLTNVTVVDNQGVAVTCPANSLAVGASMVCTASGFAVLGQYTNIGTATGTPDGGGSVSDSDTSHYNGFLTAVLASGVIGDRVWYDLDDDGVQDAGEVGIAGSTVRITGLDGQDVDPVTPGVQTSITMVTGNDGKYLFSGLPAGNYKVDTQLSWIPDPEAVGLRFTTPSSFTIALPDGGENLTADFGVVSDELAHTGLNTDTLLIVAIMLMIAGAGAVLVTRRRKDDGEDLAA